MTTLHDEVNYEFNMGSIDEETALELLEERGMNINGDIINPNSYDEWYEFSQSESDSFPF